MSPSTTVLPHSREVNKSPSLVPLDSFISIGDLVHCPGRGVATVFRFFGFTEKGVLKHFVSVKLGNGESVCLRIHHI